MPTCLRSLSAVALLALAPWCAGQAGAQQRFRSPASTWELVVTQGGGDAAEPAPCTAILVGPAGASERFELPFPNAPQEVLLADDGSALCFDDRQEFGSGVVLAALDAGGHVRWQRTLEELLPAERLALLSAGIRARTWRKRPVALEWRTEQDAREGFTLQLWNADRLHVELADGAARYEEVLDHGTDADAWLTSARAALHAQQLELAVPEYQRVVELDPQQLVAWSELAQALQRLDRTDEAIDALRLGALANPISRTPSIPGFEQTRRNVWLHTRLAQEYERTGQVELAERTALACLEIDAAMWEAAQIYAGVLWTRSETERANEFLTKTWRHLAAPPSEDLRKQTVSRAAYLIGEFYFTRGRYAEARDYYRRGFERGEYHDLLCRHLTTCHVELGQHELAIEVLAAQLEHCMQRSVEIQDPAGRQAVEERIRALEQEVARLDALARGG